LSCQLKLYIKDKFSDRLCGVRDVCCRIYKGEDKRTIPLFITEGIVGEALHKTNVQSLVLPEKCIIAMFSDGISSNFDIPLELRKLNPVKLVHVLMQKYGKSYDDRTLLIAKV
jgi:hypothetical protein